MGAALKQTYLQIDVLPTQFDKGDQNVTLATPSCCCCCCCCLITASAVTTLMAVDGTYAARENGKPSWLAPVAAILFWPVLYLALWAGQVVAERLAVPSKVPVLVFGVSATLIWAFLSRMLVGESPMKAILFGVLAMVGGAIVGVAELLVGVVTFGTVEFLLPLGFFAGFQIAKSRHPLSRKPKVEWTPNFSAHPGVGDGTPAAGPDSGGTQVPPSS